jgi:hypothetical protein
VETPERIGLRALRLTDCNGCEADLSGSAALILEDAPDTTNDEWRWMITANTDLLAYFGPQRHTL